MRLRPPKARRSRRRTARVLCGGWHQGNRRTRTTRPTALSSLIGMPERHGGVRGERVHRFAVPRHLGRPA
eukprot:2494707-Prymnesium_polylepis.1